MGHRAALISVSSALSQTSAYTARPQAIASHGCMFTPPASAGTYCTYPQAGLIWVAVMVFPAAFDYPST